MEKELKETSATPPLSFQPILNDSNNVKPLPGTEVNGNVDESTFLLKVGGNKSRNNDDKFKFNPPLNKSRIRGSSVSGGKVFASAAAAASSKSFNYGTTFTPFLSQSFNGVSPGFTPRGIVNSGAPKAFSFGRPVKKNRTNSSSKLDNTNFNNEEMTLNDNNRILETKNDPIDTFGRPPDRDEGSMCMKKLTISEQLVKCLSPWQLKFLFIFVPLAIISRYFFNAPNTLLFISSFLGLIPLAGQLGDFTEDLCLRTNPVIGALINVTFGNATELIISIFALRAGFLELIKMSLLGSVLGNMLLVLGSAFFIGGCRVKTLEFNPDAANTYIPLLMLSTFSFVIPSGYLPNIFDRSSHYSSVKNLNPASRGSEYGINAELLAQLLNANANLNSNKYGEREISAEYAARHRGAIELTDFTYSANEVYNKNDHKKNFSNIINDTLASISGSKNVWKHNVLTVSRVIALVTCITYACYTYFQLYTHKDLFDADGEVDKKDNNNNSETSNESNCSNNKKQRKGNGGKKEPHRIELPSCDALSSDNEMRNVNEIGCNLTNFNNSNIFNNFYDVESVEEEPEFTAEFGIGGLAIISLLISVLSSILVDSIYPAAEALNFSNEFLGIILVPIVGNAAEHASAIMMAYRNKLDIAIGIALGSSIQISLFMMPFLVVVGWILGIPLDMNFHPYSVGILFVSVLVAAHITCDGHSNWLEGVMLLGAYTMVGVLFYFGNVDMS